MTQHNARAKFTQSRNNSYSKARLIGIKLLLECLSGCTAGSVTPPRSP